MEFLEKALVKIQRVCIKIIMCIEYTLSDFPILDPFSIHTDRLIHTYVDDITHTCKMDIVFFLLIYEMHHKSHIGDTFHTCSYFLIISKY